MIRLFKKIVRAILCLIPCFAFLFISSPTHALKHEYNSFPLFEPEYGMNCSGGTCSLDSSSGGYNVGYGSPFWISFGSDSSVNFERLGMKISNSAFWPSYFIPGFYSELGKCFYDYNGSFPDNSFHNIFQWDYVSDTYTLSTNSYLSYVSTINSSTPGYLACRAIDQFGSNFKPQFWTDEVGVPTDSQFSSSDWPAFNSHYDPLRYLGAFTSEFNNHYVFNSFSATHTSTDNNGVTLNSNFSFSSFFTGPDSFIPDFTDLVMPLWDYYGYYLNEDNLYSGRHFEFNMDLQFDGNFSWNSDFEQNQSSIDLMIVGQSKYESDTDIYDEIPCNYSFSDNILHISCPYDLPHSLIFMYPRIRFNGHGHTLWTTDQPWYFIFTSVTTDYDDTPGYSLGNGTNYVDSWGSSDGAEDWLHSLISLFNFNFINPFAPLFQLFTDNSTCASIPTLASMLHSEENQVCPWFDSTTRNIVTPVLGMASIMLVFGFAVRWLGSSSGNLFEDSRSEEVSNQSGSWGHFKKGGK